MVRLILEDIVLYWSTAFDLLIILMMLFSTLDARQHRQIVIGQLMGSLGLIGVSLFLAYVLHFVPEKWLLGFLGLIPIYYGLKYALTPDDDEEKVARQLAKRERRGTALTVALIAFSACGADNIGLFTPFFLTLRLSELLVTLAVFVVNIGLLVVLGKRLSTLPHVHEVFEKWNRPIMAVVYIAIGLMVLVESGTVAHVIAMING